MDARSLRVLEYPAVRELVSAAATSIIGKQRALAMKPYVNLERVRLLQQETTEARDLLDRRDVPLGGIRDIRERVQAASKGGALEPSDLLDCCYTLAASRRLKASLLAEQCPALHEHAQQLGLFAEIEAEISRCISDRAEVKDSASEELQKARRAIASLRQYIVERLEAMIRSPQVGRLLQEPIVTIRHDRHCLALRSEHRGQMPGIVHDASASRATLFIEPMAVVEAGNELAEALVREREEVRKVLAALSALIGAKAAEIAATLHALAELDFIFARATVSRSMSAWPAKLSNEGTIYLNQARHPLMTGDVVPIDIRIGDQFDTLIVTGPNTGGKTVTLKTVGLLTLMAQSGLHVPASEESRLSVFRQVFADIGDEQSIQQNLSTFSSHMGQIVEVIRHAADDSLVLLDELGAGTDPAEGAALAMSILTELHRRGCCTLATTHSSQLKAFAYAHDGVENACMEFDPVTLRPTFRVRIGLPGSSNALAIASRLGLPEGIIGGAMQFLGQSYTTLDQAVARVQESQALLQQEIAAAERARQQAEHERDLAVQQREALDRKADQILREAQRRAEGLLTTTRQQVMEILDALRSKTERRAKAPKPHEVRQISMQARQRLAALSAEVDLSAPKPAAPTPAPRKPVTAVIPGQTVLVRSANTRAAVLSGPDERGMVSLRAGVLTIEAPLSDLEEVPEAGVTVSVGEHAGAEPVTAELHLRGMRVEQAIVELERYLERALASSLDRVRIVHGRGTGAVKGAVLDFLRSHPNVAEVLPAAPREGGAGATIAVLTLE
jgi:DNA mismatch repair protein MutS2